MQDLARPAGTVAAASTLAALPAGLPGSRSDPAPSRAGRPPSRPSTSRRITDVHRNLPPENLPPGENADVPAVRVRGARRTFEAELAPVPRPAGRRLRRRPGRVRGRHGPLRLRQVDPAERHRRARRRRRRHDRGRRGPRRRPRRRTGWPASAATTSASSSSSSTCSTGMSALDNLVLPGVLGGMKRRAAEARARDLLDLLGLGDRAAAGAGGAVGRVSGSAWPSRGRWSTSRACCWPTSPPARSTARAAGRCWSCSGGCTKTARRSSWSPTPPRSRPGRPGRSGCATAGSSRHDRGVAAPGVALAGGARRWCWRC